jgi:hypothetical protein
MFLAAVICLLPASAFAAGPAPDNFYGVNPGDLFKLPQAQWDTQLQAISDDGVQVVRMGAWWSDLEPGPPVNGVHGYSWGDIDKQVSALARHNLQWEPLLCFSATWGSKIPGDYSGAPAVIPRIIRTDEANASAEGLPAMPNHCSRSLASCSGPIHA